MGDRWGAAFVRIGWQASFGLGGSFAPDWVAGITGIRTGTFYKVAEDIVTLYGKTYRAVVVHSSSQDQRRQKRLERELQASYTTLEATVREAAQQEYACLADAETTAIKVRALQSAYHRVEVFVEERPSMALDGPAIRGLVWSKRCGMACRPPLHERAEVIARKRQETGCFVLLTNVPTTGEMAHRAGDILRAYKEQHDIEQNFGFLKDPLIVNSLFLKKPERIEALRLVLLLALLIWRLIERSLRLHVETTGNVLPGWDKKETTRPTTFMMLTKVASVMVLKVEPQRQLAQALSAVHQQYLAALDVPVAYFTGASGG